MASEFDSALDAVASSGVGGPSFKFSEVGDTVTGEIVAINGMDVTVYGSNPPRVKEVSPGVPARQMVVTLKTDLRNWDRVAKLPTNQDGSAQAPAEDEGLRNLYAQVTGEGSKALATSIGRAVQAAGKTGAPEVGGRLQVVLKELRPTNKGNPAKLFEARYAPPAVGSEFDGPLAAASAPAPAAAPAPAPAPAPAASANPWATSSTPPASSGFPDQPPF